MFTAVPIIVGGTAVDDIDDANELVRVIERKCYVGTRTNKDTIASRDSRNVMPRVSSVPPTIAGQGTFPNDGGLLYYGGHVLPLLWDRANNAPAEAFR
jgi:hypothetical protein